MNKLKELREQIKANPFLASALAVGGVYILASVVGAALDRKRPIVVMEKAQSLPAGGYEFYYLGTKP